MYRNSARTIWLAFGEHWLARSNCFGFDRFKSVLLLNVDGPFSHFTVFIISGTIHGTHSLSNPIALDPVLAVLNFQNFVWSHANLALCGLMVIVWNEPNCYEEIRDCVKPTAKTIGKQDNCIESCCKVNEFCSCVEKNLSDFVKFSACVNQTHTRPKNNAYTKYNERLLINLTIGRTRNIFFWIKIDPMQLPETMCASFASDIYKPCAFNSSSVNPTFHNYLHTGHLMDFVILVNRYKALVGIKYEIDREKKKKKCSKSNNDSNDNTNNNNNYSECIKCDKSY